MAPKRILHMIGSLNCGGSQTFVMTIYRNIDRSKIQFDFIIDHPDETFFAEEIKELGGRIFTLKNISECNPIRYYKQWDDFFSQNKEYKVIHGHVRSVAAIYLHIAKKFGLTTIAHSHSTSSRGNKVEQIVKNGLQIPIRYIADHFFACSWEAGRWLFGDKIIKDDRFKVIKNAIDIDQFAFNQTIRERIRSELKIENNFVIGHVGSFTYPKNHKVLLEIFHEVQRYNENAILLLIGDGALRVQVNEQISNLGLEDKVIRIGVVPNANEYLQAMDVFVFPSVFEGLGTAVIEAQASGLRCIVSDAVPREAYITDLIIPLSLEESANHWASEILLHEEKRERKHNRRVVQEAGYDVSENVRWLENFYLERSL